MFRTPLGAKPAVLRCSRCGKLVDWTHARLQVVDGCRPHLDLAAIIVRDVTEEDHPSVLALFASDFGHATLLDEGRQVALQETLSSALVAEMKGELAGALAYRLTGDALHILALATDPLWQRSGVGGHLVAEVEQLAKSKALQRVVVAATNDNLPSLYFYQRRGYVIAQLVPGGMLPHIPDPGTTGFAGIPVRDEIRLQKVI